MERTLISERDEWLKSICPRTDADKASSNELDDFHHFTLIPLLTFQNGIILAQFRKYIKKFKPAFNAYNQSTQRNFICDVMNCDPRIKNSLIASMVSVMTLDEYEFYCDHKKDVNIRIVSLVVDSLHRHLEVLH